MGQFWGEESSTGQRLTTQCPRAVCAGRLRAVHPPSVGKAGGGETPLPRATSWWGIPSVTKDPSELKTETRPFSDSAAGAGHLG